MSDIGEIRTALAKGEEVASDTSSAVQTQVSEIEQLASLYRRVLDGTGQTVLDDVGGYLQGAMEDLENAVMKLNAANEVVDGYQAGL